MKTSPDRRQTRGILGVLRRRDGAVAVEFALIAGTLVFFLFAIIEMGLIFVVNINLSNATLALSRQIRTGGIVAPGNAATTSSGVTLDLSDFKNAICSKIQIVATATCLAQLQVDLRTLSSFSSTSAVTPLNNKSFNNASLCYYSGASGSLVELRAFYLWPIVTPALLSALVNATSYQVGNTTTAGNFYVLVSSEVFKIEQNSSGANNGAGC